MASCELDGERLTVSGRLDGEAEEELKEKCAALLLSGAEVVKVDLSGVEFVVSGCIGVLVVLWIDLCAAKRRMELVASPEVKHVLDMAGLAGVFLQTPGE